MLFLRFLIGFSWFVLGGWLERIPDNEATVAPEHMRRHIYFASLTAKAQGSKERTGWTELTSPENDGQRRILSKAPRDDLLDQYDPAK